MTILSGFMTIFVTTGKMWKSYIFNVFKYFKCIYKFKLENDERRNSVKNHTRVEIASRLRNGQIFDVTVFVIIF